MGSTSTEWMDYDDMGVTTVPVIFDHATYRSFIPPALGDHVQWHLFWNEPFAQWWSQLRPAWSLTTQLAAAHTPTVTHLGPTPAEDTQMQPSIGWHGNLRFRYTAAIPTPATLIISGALRMIGGGRPRPGAATHSNNLLQAAITTGTVERLQLVSILFDWRPGVLAGTANQQPIAGTEWFYNLASPPQALHTYRPYEGKGEALHDQLRHELLLVDLAVEQ